MNQTVRIEVADIVPLKRRHRMFERDYKHSQLFVCIDRVLK